MARGLGAIPCRSAAGHALVEAGEVGGVFEAEFGGDLCGGGVGVAQQAVGFEREAAVDDFERRAGELRGGHPGERAPGHAERACVEIEAAVLAIVQLYQLAEAIKAAVGAGVGVGGRCLARQRADQGFGQREEQRITLLPLLLQHQHFACEPAGAGGGFGRKGCKAAA